MKTTIEDVMKYVWDQRRHIYKVEIRHDLQNMIMTLCLQERQEAFESGLNYQQEINYDLGYCKGKSEVSLISYNNGYEQALHDIKHNQLTEYSKEVIK